LELIEKRMPEMWVQDCSAAENLLLAAHSKGVEGCWYSCYPFDECRDSLKLVSGGKKVVSCIRSRIRNEKVSVWEYMERFKLGRHIGIYKADERVECGWLL
jgi:nitroreductase